MGRPSRYNSVIISGIRANLGEGGAPGGMNMIKINNGVIGPSFAEDKQWLAGAQGLVRNISGLPSAKFSGLVALPQPYRSTHPLRCF